MKTQHPCLYIPDKRHYYGQTMKYHTTENSNLTKWLQVIPNHSCGVVFVTVKFWNN